MLAGLENPCEPPTPFLVIVMGVSGCGKTTIGELLADKLKVPFFDGDQLHSASNINKMQNGMVNGINKNLKIKLYYISSYSTLFAKTNTVDLQQYSQCNLFYKFTFKVFHWMTRIV